MNEPIDARGKDINANPPYDKMINLHVQLQHNNMMQTGKVKRRALGPDGKVTGLYDQNPTKNSIIYEVEFPDGQVKEYAANVIAENIFRQVDHDGFSTALFDSIIDFKKNDSAIIREDRYIVTRRGRRKLRQTTVG